MPQIWLTYDEFAALFDCPAHLSRETVASLGLDRRRCHDGLTRVKLSPPLTEQFLDAVMRQRLEREIAACANSLHVLRQRMAERAGDAPRLRLRAAR